MEPQILYVAILLRVRKLNFQKCRSQEKEEGEMMTSQNPLMKPKKEEEGMMAMASQTRLTRLKKENGGTMAA